MLKKLLVGWSLVLLSGCGRGEPSSFVLGYDEVAHVEGCNIRLLHITIRDDGYPPFAAIKYNCGGLPESDLFETKWSKDYVPPPAFTMNVGDCQVFNETFYCVEGIEREKVPFKATYKWANPEHSRIERIRR